MSDIIIATLKGISFYINHEHKLIVSDDDVPEWFCLKTINGITLDYSIEYNKTYYLCVNGMKKIQFVLNDKGKINTTTTKSPACFGLLLRK